MNTRIAIAVLAVLAVFAAPAFAQEAVQATLPNVEVAATRLVMDCGNRRLPSQREVGEWSGQHNFSQVYDTRARLMGEVARACHKPGVDQVGLVAAIAADGRLRIARIEPNARRIALARAPY